MNTPRDFYDDLVDKIGEMLFGLPEAHCAYPYRTLVDAWLKQNELGPDDIERWFNQVHIDRTREDKRNKKFDEVVQQLDETHES